MFHAAPVSAADPGIFFGELARQLEGLLAGERDPIANAANMAALIFHAVPRLNWAGFYLLRGDTLVLGPFQGRPACVRIALGKGVCGAAAQSGKTQRVEDVNAFPGHIACDTASRSELVVPLMRDGMVFGVLDLDSPEPARFDAADQAAMERLAAIFVKASDPL
jgi:GAF domain-containing protein